MNDGIKRAVDYIKSNESYVEKAVSSQNAVWQQKKSDMPVLALSCGLTAEQNSWLPWSSSKKAHFDSEKMFINGLRDVLSAVNGGCGSVPSMRANMGCGIIPSLFGPQQRLFDDKMPWLTDHLSKEDIEAKCISGTFSTDCSAEFAAGMKHIEYMAEKLDENGLNNVYIYPLDLQGAIDTAHLVYGDTLFYDFYDDPGFVHKLLDASCSAVNFAMCECFKRIPRAGEVVTHYNYLVMPKESGGLKLSEDTTTLLSPALIAEFAVPYLRRILKKFGGGYVHYCGKNNYLLDAVLREPLVRGINLGNTDMHDMTEVLNKCRENKKIYVGGIHRYPGENHFDYFVRILEPSYDKNTGCFYIIPQCGCDLRERDNFIGEFKKAAEAVMK
ncbi:MAG: hypothetical protein FWH24_00045 [Oscillospiraceae bacterium]|nr:hypothetical protein [Oscillospiraceae bacterium]